MKYRKKPVVIEAFRLIKGEIIPQWFIEEWDAGNISLIGNEDGMSADINTLEGVMHASPGDYIIKGVHGELYPCKPDIFEATYDKVENYV